MAKVNTPVDYDKAKYQEPKNRKGIETFKPGPKKGAATKGAKS